VALGAGSRPEPSAAKSCCAPRPACPFTSSPHPHPTSRLLALAPTPTPTRQERKKLLSFVVVGGGPTGVEVAAEMYDMIHEDLRKLYGSLVDDVGGPAPGACGWAGCESAGPAVPLRAGSNGCRAEAAARLLAGRNHSRLPGQLACTSRPLPT
jgi:hypothetical protein